MEPRISVLLPYRDVAETIDEALSSVLVDREVPIEVIAIDDASRDASAAKVAAFRDPRVVMVRGEGAGIVRALQLGMAHARAPFLARMDGDDVSLPGRFAAQLDALSRDARLAVIGGRVEAFPAHVVQDGMRRYIAWMNALLTPVEHARDLFVEAPLCHPSVMIRRDALEQVGGYRDTEWAEDYDLWMRLDAAGWSLAKIERDVLRWREREGRLTFTDPRYSLERHRALKARFLAPKLAHIARGRALTCWGAGPTGRRFARALEQEGVRFSRFVDIDPRKIGRIARGAPIVGPDVIDRARELIVVAVGAEGARALIRAELTSRGWIEGDEFVCAA
ncbi:glycosyltransferase [Sandaracinus amylolyticus]|uniref:Glycosyl transferase, group 2 family protein n=1 Tax=Sandaracinus amylolyticus TaxID=927083 RepID=A0A0F6YI73_9BACT|nr:glycosyltransferase [Sandaracinus amylolyticus]AKF06672.1 Glycosyl transferase, group 2 family protein [Sandaracinus amylolyticus]